MRSILIKTVLIIINLVLLYYVIIENTTEFLKHTQTVENNSIFLSNYTNINNNDKVIIELIANISCFDLYKLTHYSIKSRKNGVKHKKYLSKYIVKNRIVNIDYSYNTSYKNIKVINNISNAVYELHSATVLQQEHAKVNENYFDFYKDQKKIINLHELFNFIYTNCKHNLNIYINDFSECVNFILYDYKYDALPKNKHIKTNVNIVKNNINNINLVNVFNVDDKIIVNKYTNQKIYLLCVVKYNTNTIGVNYGVNSDLKIILNINRICDNYFDCRRAYLNDLVNDYDILLNFIFIILISSFVFIISSFVFNLIF